MLAEIKGENMEAKIIIIATALLAVSEALALIPALKSNSVLTLLGNIAKTVMGKK